MASSGRFLRTVESNMEQLLDRLPGVSMSVRELTKLASEMWMTDMNSDKDGSGDFRASQMNLILHFGLKTTGDELETRFNEAIEFAQIYPCKIIVLCPLIGADEDAPLKGKLFSQCYLGSKFRDVCCCEALMLSYPLDTSTLLDHQVSLWLDSDLPVYHWLHRVPRSRIEKHYLPFLKRCSRVIYDRDIEEDAYDSIDWPVPHRVRDLSYARTLPIRQNLGQFFSSFEPKRLVEGLTTIKVGCCAHYGGEARQLSRWLRNAIEGCVKQVKGAQLPLFEIVALTEESESTLEVNWAFSDPEKYLNWTFNAHARMGNISCNFGGEAVSQSMHIESLTGAKSLSEALFFGAGLDS